MLVVLWAALFGLVFAQSGQAAAPDNDDALAIKNALTSLTSTLDGLAGHDILADAVPLTGLDPTSTSGLNLADVLNALPSNLGSDFTEADPLSADGREAIRNAIEDVDDGGLTVGGVDIVVGCPGTAESCGTPNAPVTVVQTPDGKIDFTIPVRATRSVTQPVSFSTNVADLTGGSLNADLVAAVTIPVRYDPTLRTTAPTQAVSLLVTPTTPSLDLSASLTSPTASLSANIGITDVTAALSGLNVNVALGARLVDPDGDGRITQDEWTATALNDLTTLSRSGAAAGTLTFDTGLTSTTTPDLSVPFNQTLNTTTGFSFPSVSLGSLASFTNVTPEQIVSGLASAAAAIAGSQGEGDADLPFLDGTISDIARAAQPLVDFVDKQAVVCGTTDATPPTGSVERLAAGADVFCQAFVSQTPVAGSVTWTVPAGTPAAPLATGSNTSGADADGTVGPTPTKRAKFRMSGAGRFDAEAAYQVLEGGATVNKTSERPPSSVQQLVTKLAQLGGFDPAPDGVGSKIESYDSGTEALRFHLKRTFDPGAATVAYDFGDQLEKSSGVVGLQVVGTPAMSATADDISIDITFGVLLGALSQIGTGQPCPDPTVTTGPCPTTELDRFFVEVNPTAPELKVQNATFTATLPTLKGRLGFLDITATADALTVSRATTTDPLFRLDVNVPAGGLNVGTATLSNAVRLRELLFKLPQLIPAPQLNLQMSGGVNVTAKAGATSLGSGHIGIAWPNVTTGLPTVTVDTSFTDQLSKLNLSPNLFGTHDAATASGTTLTHSTATFPADIVGKRLENMTDGSFCTVTAQTATTATCTLAGGADNQWQQGDEYRIEVGDPLAMLWLLLDNLDDVVDGLDSLTGGAAGDVFTADLPFVGMSARDIFTQVEDLRRTLTELRGGPGPSIECGTQKSVNTADGTTTNHAVDTVPPVGDPSQLGGPATIYCAATTPKPATGLTWSVTGGSIADADKTKADTVGTSPTKTVPVAITAPGNIASDENPTGYRVRLVYTDVDGDHTVEYPSVNVPLTLEDLGKAIENKLGLPAGTIVFGTTNTGGTRKLTIGLNYQRCTGFGSDPTAFCDGKAPNASPLNAPLNVGLGSAGSIASVGAAADVQVAYNASARLDVAVPLSTTPSVEVLPTSGLTLKGRFDAANIDLQANLGPIGIKAGVNGKPTGDGAGVLKIGADFTLNGPATASSPSAWIAGLNANFTAPPNQTCGTLTLDDNDPTTATDPTTDLEGLACGRVAVGFVKPDNSVEYLSDVGFEANLAADNKSFTVTPEVPPALTSKLAAMVLDWDMLLRALPDLLTRLEEGLEASANSGTGNSKLPIVGDALDAGADIVNKVNTGVVTPTIDAIGPVLDTATEPSEVQSKIKTFLFTTMGPSSSANLLRRGFADNTAPTESDIVVDLECGSGVVCTDTAHDLLNITDVHVRFNVGQAVGTPQGGVPFDVGLDGLPIKVAGSVASQVGWNLVVDLGLNRDGPYLVVDDGSGTRKELQVQASVGLGEDATVCSSVIDDPTTGSITTAIPTFTASNRCLAGQLGFVGVNLRDNATTPSGLTLTAFLDLTREGGGTKLTLSDLVGGKLQAAVGITANAGINVRFRTGVPTDQLAGFPSVVGTFSAGWSWDSTVPGTLAPPTVAFGNLHLDASAFVQKYLAPTLAEIRNVTGPFGPVADTLTAPLPVISDLAALVGKPPITLLSLMEAVSGNNLTVIKTLAAFIQFANNPIVADGLIPLGNTGAGSFNVDANAAKTPKGPNDASSLISGGSNKGTGLFSKPAVGGNSSQLTTRVNAAKPTTQDNLPGTFGVPGLTFPFMEDAGQIFGFLMGQDITLIRFEVGRLRATAGFNYDFGPFFIGPVPVTAGVGGSVTLSGRFAIGYDTSGIRKVLAGGSGVHLFDGIFIDDLDSSGVDVPEVSLVGEVYARAAVTVFIASAGIEGGLRFTLDLNLDDTPQPDGKLRIEEVFNKLSNPICLFDVHGQLDLFLRFFLEIDYFVGSERWDFTIVELTLLEFSAACAPPKPKLANLSGTGVLTLNVGSEDKRKARQVAVDTRHEKVIVRPAGGGRYSVEAFGVYQVYGPGAPFPGAAITKVVAHADDGNDTILLEPGKDENANLNNASASIPFTAVGEIHGGPETDTISGGDAADTLRGDGGTDKIGGGKGGDDIAGGSEADNIDGGQGNDYIDGDGGADRISGGPGTDDIDGGGDGDFLSGGPGTDPAVSSNPAESRDLNDTIVGGDGGDQLDGSFGDDDMYGDAVLACTANGSLVNDDLVEGGPGDDNMWGGAGNDTMVGGPGHDDLCGNAGNDDLDGDNPDLDAAGGGNDTFNGGSGADEILGRSGHDVATGAGNRDKVDGGLGNDDLAGGTGSDVVTGGAGLDVIVGDIATIASSDRATRSSASQATRVALVSGEGTLDGGTANCAYAQDAAAESETGRADCLQGGVDHDVLFGESGPDQVFGDDGEDWESGGAGADVMRGGKHADVMHGNAGTDEMHGDSGADTMFGGDDVDTMRGGIDGDYMEGNNHADVMNGDGEADKMVGGSASASAADGADTMHGDAANDVMIGDNGVIAADGTATMSDGGAGTFGDDTITGDGDDDRIYGHLGGDTIDGNTGHDYVVGDMGSITPGTPSGTWPGGAPIYAVALVDADKGGVDIVKGGDGNDHVYAGAAGDTVEGNAGDDYVEGNSGDDSIYGFNATVDDGVVQASDTADRLTMSLVGDQDDLIGGSSTAVDGRTTTPDTGESLIAGNGDHDVITGDNADVTRVVDPGDATQWADDPIIPSARARTVVLRDREKTGADLAAVSGNDEIVGNDGSDRAYGEGGQDCIKGNANDDFLEGNQDVDCIEGNDGEDDIIGGSSTEVGGSPGVGDPDSGDFLHGGAGADVIAADNATIARSALTDPTLQTDGRWLGVVAARWVKLLDVTTLDATRFGADAVSGGQGADIAFGQDGDDWLSGGSEDDHIQGNGGVDNVFGDRLLSDASVTGDPTLPASLTGCPSADAAQLDGAQGAAGQDDIVGGSERAGQRDTGDTIFGDGGEDFALGDNGTLYRNITAGAYVTTLHKYGNDGEGFVRTVTLFDREKTGDALAAVSGGDRIEGNDGGDRLFGEGGDDSVKGNNHDDYAEGDQGRDWVEGNDGQDDLVGGSSFALGNAGVEAQRSDPDDGDFLYGGEGHDVVAGDNAVVARTASEAGTPVYFTTDGRLLEPTDRWIRLFDLDSLRAGAYGGDLISGGQAVDVGFGQDGDDWLSGGSEGDYLEGNGANDRFYGDRLPSDATVAGVPAVPASLAGMSSGQPQLDGVQGPHGQDDIVGGSLLPGHRDGNDRVSADGAQDFALGDNGSLVRELLGAVYGTYTSAEDTARIRRNAERFDVATPAAAGVWGNDVMEGNAGDDAMWGQDGNDELWGNGEDDDLFGELGNDRAFGGPGEDSLIGDRGGVTNTLVTAAMMADPASPFFSYTVSTPSPPFVTYHAFKAHPLDRRVDLLNEKAGSVGGPFTGNRVVTHNGRDHGGHDLLRGGADHDSLHGTFGDDIVNGDSGGDYVYGDDGSDVMWGGRGSNDPANTGDRGVFDGFVDYVFGGHGGNPANDAGVVTGGADILDYIPRVGTDPQAWHDAVAVYNDLDGNVQESLRQHNQGIDWVYGGWDRDVMQANMEKVGPNDGDRLIDWTGAYNLYTHCSPDYGGYNDIRAISPQMLDFLQRLAYATGVGSSVSAVTDPATSAYRELALVYQKNDVKLNSGKAYPTTPGHFENIACSEN